MNTSDTIAAISTGSAISAIGIVRVSGPQALTAADNIFRAKNVTKPAQWTLPKDAKDRHLYYGGLHDASGALIDLCLCTISRAPNTYTGEDTVEFHCHGSPVVLTEVLKALFNQGVRPAQAGEFTKRAFLNGRMDLTQAEAVIDLIEAETPYAAKNAAGQLQGAVYTKMNEIYDKLVDIMAHFHAVVDYPDEDIDEFAMENYLSTLQESSENLRCLLDTHERGKVLHTGIPTAIVGRTNTGKSSLFNALLGFDRAIVTDIEGTTRDTIEEKVLIGNVLLRVIDTAGLRKTRDTVEQLGVERSLASIQSAGLILLVLDGSQPLQEDDCKVMEIVRTNAPKVPYIIILNKADLPTAHRDGPCAMFGIDTENLVMKKNNTQEPSLYAVPTITLSAKTGEGIDMLAAEIQSIFPAYTTPPAGEVITSVRQAEAIARAINSVEQAEKSLTDKVSPDAVLTDLEDALSAIGEVTGKTMREDIIARIFERFCIGK